MERAKRKKASNLKKAKIELAHLKYILNLNLFKLAFPNELKTFFIDK